MMSLECEKVVVYKVDYNQIEKLIREFCGQWFSIPHDQESSNDSTINLTVKKDELNEWEEQSVTDFIETGEHTFLLQSFMTYLCNIGYVNEGNYVIDVSW